MTGQPPLAGRPPHKGQPRRTEVSPWPFVGVGGMAAVFFPYAASGMVAPAYGVVVLLLIWGALFALACSWWTRHPKGSALVPLVAMGILFAVVWFGAAFLGWRP